MDKTIFGQRLLTLRTNQNLSQLALAQALGLRNSTISMIESGQRAASVDTLIALADYFDVSLDYLVGRSDNPQRG